MANNKFQRYRYEFQKIHGNAVKQEESRGESFLEGLSEADKQAVHELADFCNKYGLEKQKKIFNLGHEIDIERKRIGRKNHKKVDSNASNYINNLPEYQRESYRIYKRWQQRHSIDTKAKKEFERIYELCRHHRRLSGQAQALSHSEHLDLEVGHGQQSVSAAATSHPDHQNSRYESFSSESPLDYLRDMQLLNHFNGMDFPNRLRDIDLLDLESISTPVASHHDSPNTQHESRSIEKDLLDLESVSTPVVGYHDSPNPQDESLPSERGLESLSERDNERDGVDHHETRLEREAPSLSHEETLILKDSFIYPIRKDGRIQECRIGAGSPESSDIAFADPNFLNPYLISLNGDGSRSSPVSNLLKSWNQRQSFLTNEADLDLSSFDYMLSDINNPYNCQTGLVNSFLRDNDDFMNLHSSSVSEIHFGGTLY